MRILIFGSEGFIGRHCVNFFLQNGWAVSGCDLVDYPSADYEYTKISRLQPLFAGLFEQHQYDACINASGNGSVPVSISNPISDFEANCADVIQILDLLRTKNNKCKYLHISSAAIYGNPQQLPVTEQSQAKPLSPYGWHKYMAEMLCQQYHALYNLPIVIVRPFSVYGPGLHKQLFWDLYQKYRQNPAELNLWGTGNETRDFIHIFDLVSAFNLILQNAAMQAEVYNVASGEEITIAAAVDLFFNGMDSRPLVKFNNLERAGDPTKWRADIGKLQSLGYQSKQTFANGITETLKWLKNLP